MSSPRVRATAALGVALALLPLSAATASAEDRLDPAASARPSFVGATTASRASVLAAGRRPTPGTRAPGLSTPMPKPPVTLPAALDRKAGYVAQITCDPTDKPGTLAYGQLLKSIRPSSVVGYSRSCTEAGTSEHKDGRAVDFMIDASDPAQKRIADDIVTWITADDGAIARRLGVMYLIWNKQIWGIYDTKGGWKPYSGSNPHTDHIHTSLTWDGAMKQTSWWTGVALTTWDEGPCRAYVGELAPIRTARNIDDCAAPVPPPRTTHKSAVLGTRSADVTVAQKLLGAPATGTFDARTWTVVKDWQKLKGVAVTGVLDQKTWSMIDPSSVR